MNNSAKIERKRKQTRRKQGKKKEDRIKSDMSGTINRYVLVK